MAGHSQFANIKHRKAGQDAKKAKLFTKLVREIQISASTGSVDPGFNPRLRNALSAARKAGVQRDRIETAIKKATGEIAGNNLAEIRYEGYGPGGVAIIVEALSDNRNRTASEVRTAFTKYGGALGETGCVNFMFDKVGIIEYKKEVANNDEIFEAVIEAGADDVESDDSFHYITASPDNFGTVRDILAKKYGDPETAKLTWRAKESNALNKEAAETILKLVDALEDSDDVQEVIGNFVISQEILDAIDK